MSSKQFEPLMKFDERYSQIREKYSENSKLTRRLEIFDRACAVVDRDAVARLQKKYSGLIEGDIDSIGPLKYLDIPYYIWHKAHILERLDLDKSKPKILLDLGMGAGHFGLMCAAFGHLTYGLDLDDPFYEDFCNAFGLTRKTKAIKKFEPLPDFGTKFDIITAFSLMFHFENYGTHRVYWQRDEWGWFLSDICKHLNPEASVYLIINPELLPDGRIEMQHKLTELFARSGAKVLIPGRAVLWQVKGAKISLPGPDIPEGLFTDQIKRL